MPVTVATVLQTYVYAVAGLCRLADLADHTAWFPQLVFGSSHRLTRIYPLPGLRARYRGYTAELRRFATLYLVLQRLSSSALPLLPIAQLDVTVAACTYAAHAQFMLRDVSARPATVVRTYVPPTLVLQFTVARCVGCLQMV